MVDDRMRQLMAEAQTHRYSRRQLVQRAATLGVSMPALTVMMAAGAQRAAAQGAENPLGVDPEAPLEVVIFDGGYGDEYAVNVNDTLYGQLYPNAEIDYTATTRLGPQYQPRFVSGEPPDVMDNSGAESLDEAVLVAEGQIADLAPLMAAASYDTEGATFGDTLIPNTQNSGVFEGVQRYLNFVISGSGIWYNQAFMDENGFTYPTTWDEMMALSAEIQALGVAPWTHTGVYPQYIRGFVFDPMLWKHAGPEAIVNIDNLETDAWRTQEVRDVLEAIYMLAENDYILEGSAGLTHTDSQAAWLQGQAIFIPVGTWLENEMSGLIPEDFQMTFAPTPSLSADDPVPFEGIFAGAGEVFIVPEQAANVPGGMEWLRLLFSREGGRFFTETTRNLTVVQGSAEGLGSLSPAFDSFQAALDAAGGFEGNTFESRYGGWYPDLEQVAKDSINAMLIQQLSVDEVIESIQATADQVRDDPSVTKFTREMPSE